MLKFLFSLSLSLCCTSRHSSLYSSTKTRRVEQLVLAVKIDRLSFSLSPTYRAALHSLFFILRKNELLLLLMPFFLWKETNKRGLRIRLCLRTVWRVFTNESRDLLFFGALYIDDGAAAAVVQWEKEAGSATSTTSSLPITQPPTHTHTHTRFGD